MAADPIVSWSAALLISLLFAMAAWHKLSDLSDFRNALAAYRLLPGWSVTPVAGLLIVLEVGVALALLLGVGGAVFAALALLGGYSFAMLINLWRGRRYIDCGCGGPGQPLSYGLVMRNAVLMLVCLLARPGSIELDALEAFTVVVAVTSAALLYGAANHILTLRASLDEPEL